MFTLAHVTDPHFRSFAGARPGAFLGKRAIGALNLVVNRRRKHRMELLEDLGADLSARAPTHLAVTGDLGNVSLESEWLEARRWIEARGLAPEAITVIPGNHDVYVADVTKTGAFERIFAPYQTAELRVDGAPYPFARLRDGVALIGVSTCVPTGDLGAWGEIGAAQLERLEALLVHPDVRARTRVVLLHHPPVVHRPPEHRNLRDRDALTALLSRAGADLVLHGHDHRDEAVELAGPGGGKIPAIGAGSASYAGSAERRARYNIYEIDGRSITAVTFAHDENASRFVEVSRRTLS